MGAHPTLTPEKTLYFVCLLLESATVPEDRDVPGVVDDLLPMPLNP